MNKKHNRLVARGDRYVLVNENNGHERVASVCIDWVWYESEPTCLLLDRADAAGLPPSTKMALNIDDMDADNLSDYLLAAGAIAEIRGQMRVLGQRETELRAKLYSKKNR